MHAEILLFAAKYKLNYIEDTYNVETKFDHNFIRHRLLFNSQRKMT
jgi:tRNA(Ile)-lysidine synthase TilS/MesJ